MLKISHATLPGLIIIEPHKMTDNRGYFFENYQQKKYQETGIPIFVQDNFSLSMRNVLRGLHYQLPQPQGKLVYVTYGKVWDVVVDIRLTSPTFGQWFGLYLNDENNIQFYIPPGFAHGFCVLSDEAHFHYKCTDYYSPQSECGIAWNDTTLDITWPVQDPLLSVKDTLYPNLNSIPHEKLFA